MEGSKPANAKQASADLNLVKSPNSATIEAHKILPIPLIERQRGLSKTINSFILSSINDMSKKYSIPLLPISSYVVAISLGK